MKPSEALAKASKADIARIVSENMCSNPRVFGSVLHGDDTEASDLDVLVDITPETSIVDLGAIQYDLTELLGVYVDVSTPGGLAKRGRSEVLAEARAI